MSDLLDNTWDLAPNHPDLSAIINHLNTTYLGQSVVTVAYDTANAPNDELSPSFRRVTAYSLFKLKILQGQYWLMVPVDALDVALTPVIHEGAEYRGRVTINGSHTVFKAPYLEGIGEPRLYWRHLSITLLNASSAERDER